MAVLLTNRRPPGAVAVVAGAHNPQSAIAIGIPHSVAKSFARFVGSNTSETTK